MQDIGLPKPTARFSVPEDIRLQLSPETQQALQDYESGYADITQATPMARAEVEEIALDDLGSKSLADIKAAAQTREDIRYDAWRKSYQLARAGQTLAGMLREDLRSLLDAADDAIKSTQASAKKVFIQAGWAEGQPGLDAQINNAALVRAATRHKDDLRRIDGRVSNAQGHAATDEGAALESLEGLARVAIGLEPAPAPPQGSNRQKASDDNAPSFSMASDGGSRTDGGPRTSTQYKPAHAG